MVSNAHGARPRRFGWGQAFSRRATLVWALIVGVLLAAGAYFMFDRLANGLGMAGATNAVPWGLWVVVYIWFSGLAGGLYLISALAYLLRLARFMPVARLALGLSVVSLAVSMIFIGLDLGSIRHSLGTVLFFHWSSPLAWEIKAYMFFMAVAVAQFALVLWNDRRGKLAGGVAVGSGVQGAADGAGAPATAAGGVAGRAGAATAGGTAALRRRGNVNLAIRVLAGVGVATSFVGPPGGTGMFFAAVKTRGLWEGGITSVLFYVMAVVTAAAFLIVAYRLLARLRGAQPEARVLTGLAGVLAASLFALAFCVFFQVAPALLSGDPAVAAPVQVMVAGPLALLFWLGEVGVGMVLPAVLLAVGAARSRGAGGAVAGGAWAVAAAIAAMAGVLALRYVLVVAGFSAPLLAGMPAPAYVPSLGEMMVALFVLGLAVAAFGLVVRLLPLERRGAAEGAAQPQSVYATTIEQQMRADTRGEGSMGREVRDGGAA